MSNSSDLSTIKVIADSGFPTASVSILNSDFLPVVRGGGRIEADLPAGLYMVRYSTGSDEVEEIFIVSPAENPKILPKPKLVLPNAAVIAGAPGAFEDIKDLAVTLSKQPGRACGTGSDCFIFVMDLPPDCRPGSSMSAAPPHPADGLKLLTFDGTLLVDLGSATPKQGCAGVNISLNPGSYLLRLVRHEQDALEQTVVTCPGWQTQVLLPLQLLSTSSPVRQANLENATVLMSPLGQGLNTDENIIDWTEMARQWLALGEPVAPVARLREAVKDANECRQHAENEDALRDMLRNKFTNPMLGIYAAHLLMLTPDPDQNLLREVSTNLKILLGAHPDVTAIDLWLDRNTGAPPFLSPPMLRSSWKVLVNRSEQTEALIPVGSYSVRITDRLWGSGAWLVWCTPPRLEVVQIPESADLSTLSAYVRKQLSTEKSASQFVYEEVAAKQLTGLEVSVLGYIVCVVEGQDFANTLASQLGKIGWLGPLSGLVRKWLPSDLEKKAAQTAQDFLVKGSVVESLGIPQAAVSAAVAGLYKKFGLK